MQEEEHEMEKELTRFTEAEYGNAKALFDALEGRREHIVDINQDVFINHVGRDTFGEKVWMAMRKRMRKEGEEHVG